MAKLRFLIALVAAKFAKFAIKLLGRNASHNPGVIALKICPDFLKLAPKAPLVICVTGTNGKTTVSNLLTDAFTADGKRVVSNRTGSNIVPGCTTNLINSLNIFGKVKVDVTVYEVDERASRLILPYLKPDYLVVTNFFRDSLKRNAHPDYIFSVVDTYCPDTTKLILNADELCSARLKESNERVFYGIGEMATDIKESINIVADYSLCPKCGTQLKYDYLRYHHIGHAKCPNCDFESKNADYLVTNVDSVNKAFTLTHNGKDMVFPLINDIIFNIYNQLTVITTLLQVGYSDEQVLELVKKIHVPDSRLNHTEVKGVKVTQAMSKGQSCISSCRTFDFVSSQPGKKAVIIAVDDYYDRKKSIEFAGWIYDVDYEFMTREGVEQVICTGPRCYDHKVRALLAGVPEEKIACSLDEMAGIDLVNTDLVDNVFILYDTSTYNLSCRMKDKLLAVLEASK